MKRIYERQTDALFLAAFCRNPSFVAAFLNLIEGIPGNKVRCVASQTRHRGTGQTGTIDLEITCEDGLTLLVENKIDAGYSVTRVGDPQPERYQASVAAMRAEGRCAASVLLAPEVYLLGTRHSAKFDHQISYEALRPIFQGDELALLDAAILQAGTPYNPEPNPLSADFFAAYADFACQHFPELVIKRNPNGNGVQPTGSNTIYFDVAKTLRDWAHLARPRMSLQCRDSLAPSASVKIMLGGWAANAQTVRAPDNLAETGGYIRPAGRSLGFVIDTPQLDTQIPFSVQISEVEKGLEAALRLAAWWNHHAGEVSA